MTRAHPTPDAARQALENERLELGFDPGSRAAEVGAARLEGATERADRCRVEGTGQPMLGIEAVYADGTSLFARRCQYVRRRDAIVPSGGRPGDERARKKGSPNAAKLEKPWRWGPARPVCANSPARHPALMARGPTKFKSKR